MTTINYKNPSIYLNELVAKKGKSGARGVYVTNVSVVADASADYGFKVNVAGCNPQRPPYDVDVVEWLTLLVSLRVDNPQMPMSLSSSEDKVIYQFVPEGGSLSMNVFLPELDMEMFETHVYECQDMLRCVTDFTGKLSTYIRFQIGYVNKNWEDLAEDGEVEEQDFSF